MQCNAHELKPRNIVATEKLHVCMRVEKASPLHILKGKHRTLFYM